jgi:hypothetical protein
MADLHTVYVDDSGSDPKSQVASAAFCVSTVERWKEFEIEWRKIADCNGFDLQYFHMTEFAACRRNSLCQQCRNGKTNTKEHPWQKWSNEKRENVLRRLAKAVVKHTECGFGIAHTKQDYEDHVKNSPARALAKEPIGDEHFTFSVQQCGGRLAEWRYERGIDTPLNFVFDNSSKAERREIAEVFFAAAKDRTKYQGGIEQWFEPDGVSFQSRKRLPQLLAADMVAWTVATLRARQLFSTGRNVELFQVADILVASDHIKIGSTDRQTLAEWEQNNLKSTSGPDYEAD